MKDIIEFNDFMKLDMRVGLVEKAEKKEGSDKLIRLKVNLGPEIGTRNILAGIAVWYKPSQLTGKKFIFVVNLMPKKMMGEESQGMILAADVEGKAVIIPVPKKIKEGTIIR